MCDSLMKCPRKKDFAEINRKLAFLERENARLSRENVALKTVYNDVSEKLKNKKYLNKKKKTENE